MNNFFDQTDFFTKTWMDWFSKMADMSMSFQPGTSPPEAARQMRSGMFQAMSQFFDNFMRSPQMLDMMKNSMDSTLDARKQFNDFMTKMRHEAQGAASEDIDDIMRSMRHLEERVLDRLDDVTTQLDRINRRLVTLESSETETVERTNGHSASARGAHRNSRETSSRLGKHHDDE